MKTPWVVSEKYLILMSHHEEGILSTHTSPRYPMGCLQEALDLTVIHDSSSLITHTSLMTQTPTTFTSSVDPTYNFSHFSFNMNHLPSWLSNSIAPYGNTCTTWNSASHLDVNPP